MLGGHGWWRPEIVIPSRSLLDHESCKSWATRYFDDLISLRGAVQDLRNTKECRHSTASDCSEMTAKKDYQKTILETVSTGDGRHGVQDKMLLMQVANLKRCVVVCCGIPRFVGARPARR